MAFERCLRDLQQLLKELRALQVAANPGPAAGGAPAAGAAANDGAAASAPQKSRRKKSGPKQFLSLQRKLFLKLTRLRAILFLQCTGGPSTGGSKTNKTSTGGSKTNKTNKTNATTPTAAPSSSSFTGKNGTLAKLQAPCEKLLRGLLERLGSAASHGGFTLTPAVYAAVADCLELVYRYGSQRTLLESMAKWEQSLLDKQTTPAARAAMFHCAEALFVAQGRRLGSYLGTFVACAAKQFKLVRGAAHGNDACAANVRAAGIRCVGRAVHATGSAGLSEHVAILKLCKTGC